VQKVKKRNRDYTVPRHTNDSRIAQARLAKGWTQTQLADAIGVGQTQIANWESGFRKPKMDALMRIGAALGVDWTTLIEQPQK
jgi:transcriptional regulator with XRE-family HTH domain